MASKKQLQEDFKKERAKAMKYFRLREDCKNVGGERWSGFNTKAILSEEKAYKLQKQILKREGKVLGKHDFGPPIY